MARFHVPCTKILKFFNFSHWFLIIFGQCEDNCKQNLFLRRKVGVTERTRSLNPPKAITMAIIVYFSTLHAHSMHDMACEGRGRKEEQGRAETIGTNALKCELASVKRFQSWRFKCYSFNEGLTLETSAFESLYGGQFTLSTQLTKPN